jgi:hypothetical protein
MNAADTPGADQVTVETTTKIDYVETARVANMVFEKTGVEISAPHLEWLYTRAFSSGASIVELRHGHRKVGQIAMLRQDMMANGVRESTVQVVDLFVEKAFRSKANLTLLYQTAVHQCERETIAMALGMPNTAALSANEYFFGLRPHTVLDIRVGLSLPLGRPGPLIRNEQFQQAAAGGLVPFFSTFATPPGENGVAWDGERLFQRLCDAEQRYGLHAVKNLLLISSPRSRKGIDYVLLCGFFAGQQGKPDKGDVRAVTRAACAFWRKPVFVFPGLNAALPVLPGWKLPAALRPSPMLLQVRDFRTGQAPLRLQRFQALDFDFA